VKTFDIEKIVQIGGRVDERSSSFVDEVGGLECDDDFSWVVWIPMTRKAHLELSDDDVEHPALWVPLKDRNVDVELDDG
jgi:hypothetical protein